MNKFIYKSLIFSSALVWLINGLYCKVLGGAPRHQEIVSEILGREHATSIVMFIGLSEILMSIWIVSGIQRKCNIYTQIVLIVTMNIIEFFCVPELLLWGKLNVVFAILFSVVLYYTEFIFKKKLLST